MLYELHDLSRDVLRPWAAYAAASAGLLRRAPVPGAPAAAAGWELLHRLTRDYPRPAFGLDTVETAHGEVALAEEVVEATPFCRLLRFRRLAPSDGVARALGREPRVLLVAPLSGHHATLLRETVHGLAAAHEVFVTDWICASQIPTTAGRFGLDDYVEHLMAFLRGRLREEAELHVVAVCQPGPAALAAVSLLAEEGLAPRSLAILGAPIDGRIGATEVNRLAERHPLAWFERRLVHRVGARHPGAGRRVYPGFLQLAAFVSMNAPRHARAHRRYWLDRLEGAHDDARRHEAFYDEYNAVLDMDADYYLDTVRVVFQEHALPRGTWDVRGRLVEPSRVRHTALLTVEGEEDDITGRGQCHAAHALCAGLAAVHKRRLTVPGAGHYGIFSGRRFRDEVLPVLSAHIADHRAPLDAPRALLGA
jgi:poly(3-hydroxybutyrate) depolymerase